MPVTLFKETILGSASVAPAAMLDCNIILGLDQSGAFLKLVRRADNVPYFMYEFSDDMIGRWADDLKTIRHQQHERAVLALEQAEREAAASSILQEVRADGVCQCPVCFATASAEEIKQYGRVVCPCWMASAMD